MPGDRRQILSLLRLPIPPLQPLSFLSVNRPSCNCICKLGKLGKDKLSQFFNRLTLCSLVSLSINESHVGIAVTQHILLRLERYTVVVHRLQIASYPNPWSLSTCKTMPCLETSSQQPPIPDSEGLSELIVAGSNLMSTSKLDYCPTAPTHWRRFRTRTGSRIQVLEV